MQQVLLEVVEEALEDQVALHLQTLLVVMAEQEHPMFMLMVQLTQLLMLVAAVVVDIVQDQ